MYTQIRQKKLLESKAQIETNDDTRSDSAASYGTSDNQDEDVAIYKLMLVGSWGTGKSSLSQKFAEDNFTEDYMTTVGVDFVTKTIRLKSKEKVKLFIWDTAGEDKFRIVTTTYYKGIHGVIIVFDLTDQESFDNIPMWMDEVSTYTQDGGHKVGKVLVGTKSDLIESRVISAESAQQLAQSLTVPYMETSAKENENVNDVFISIAEEIAGNLRTGN